MPVQWVNRPNSDFRGFAGTIVSGGIRPGDEIAVLPSGQTTRIKSIIGAGGEVTSAEAGDAVTVTLADELDVARGDMLAAPNATARRSPTSSPRTWSGCRMKACCPAAPI